MQFVIHKSVGLKKHVPIQRVEQSDLTPKEAVESLKSEEWIDVLSVSSVLRLGFLLLHFALILVKLFLVQRVEY